MNPCRNSSQGVNSLFAQEKGHWTNDNHHSLIVTIITMMIHFKGSVLEEKEEGDGLWANDGEVWSLQCAPGYQVLCCDQ